MHHLEKKRSEVFPTTDAVKGETTNPGTNWYSRMYGDATLTIMTSKNNPIMEVRFSDLYPVSLGALQFDQQATDITYLTATATFSYKLYEMFTI